MQKPEPRFTEMERKRRWSLIVQAILDDPGVPQPARAEDDPKRSDQRGTDDEQ